MLHVYIGPNGFGKTYKLEEIKKDLIDNNGVKEEEILFFESKAIDGCEDLQDCV